MGHMHVDNISKRLISKLSAGPISAKEFVDDAIAKRVNVFCSEGHYQGEEHDYLFYMAFYDCVAYHAGIGWKGEPADVRAVLRTKADREAWRLWKSGDIWDVDDRGESPTPQEKMFARVDAIRVELTPRGRRKLKTGFRHPGTITH